MCKRPDTIPPAVSTEPDGPNPITHFLKDETGAALVEYVTLLIAMLGFFSFLIQPLPLGQSEDNLPALQNALMVFSYDSFADLSKP